MTVECNAGRFRNLRNPYTGERMRVSMVTGGDRPMFLCTDTYSTTDAFPTSEEALAAWNRTGGIAGMRDASLPRCAYTGETLTMIQTAAGFRFCGGFNPKRLMTDEELLHFAAMRDGSSPNPPPSAPSRIELVERPDVVAERIASDTVERTDDARRIAESVVDRYRDELGMKDERTAVSMSRRKRK